MLDINVYKLLDNKMSFARESYIEKTGIDPVYDYRGYILKSIWAWLSAIVFAIYASKGFSDAMDSGWLMGSLLTIMNVSWMYLAHLVIKHTVKLKSQELFDSIIHINALFNRELQDMMKSSQSPRDTLRKALVGDIVDTAASQLCSEEHIIATFGFKEWITKAQKAGVVVGCLSPGETVQYFYSLAREIRRKQLMEAGLKANQA